MRDLRTRPLGFGEFGVRAAAWIMRAIGWRIRGEHPGVDKCVFTCAPHISNWDLLLMMLTALALRLPVYFLMKDSAFIGPMGWLWRNMGGIPVNRRERKNLVDTMAELFASHDRMYLVIAPEGTRHNTGEWRTGYYWMAHNAGVAVVCAHCDYVRKSTGVGGLHYTTGDVVADFEIVKRHYNEVMPEYQLSLSPQARENKAGEPPQKLAS